MSQTFTKFDPVNSYFSYLLNIFMTFCRLHSPIGKRIKSTGNLEKLPMRGGRLMWKIPLFHYWPCLLLLLYDMIHHAFLYNRVLYQIWWSSILRSFPASVQSDCHYRLKGRRTPSEFWFVTCHDNPVQWATGQQSRTSEFMICKNTLKIFQATCRRKHKLQKNSLYLINNQLCRGLVYTGDIWW